jgi:hypothetical protein
MPFTLRVRPTLAVCAAIVTAALAGCADAPPPAAPPAPPPVAISPRLLDMASGYRTYVTRASAISPAFTDGTAVANSLTTGASYDSQQFLRGAIAYGAVVALKDRAFAAVLRAQAKDAFQRQKIAYAILTDPYYVTSFPGAASAGAAVSAALSADGRALYDQGGRVKQAAYDIQLMPWAKTEVFNRPLRLQQAKTPPPLAGDLAETERLRQSLASIAPTSVLAPPATATYPSIVVRALAVAAVAALGEADAGGRDLLTPLMADSIGGNCLSHAKLDLYQCLAVAKPHYEDVFCLGQHAIMDAGVCLLKSTGAELPAGAIRKPIAVSDSARPYRPAAKPKPKAKAKPKAKSS